MRKLLLATISWSFLAAALGAPAWANEAARPGTLNYVEGQASIGNTSLNAKSVGSTELKPGQTLATHAGKAEVLLTPGVFFRVGDQSVVRMISPNLTDTEVELVQGNATVEVTDIHRENDLRIIEDGRSTELLKNGLYDFDADHQKVRVFDGEALMQDGGKQVKIKGGHEVNFGAGEPLKSRKFDKQSVESTDLYRWTSLRSSYLAEANADAARTYAVGGWGWYDGWYWDPWFGAYTFLPGDGIFYSPFGWDSIRRDMRIGRRGSMAGGTTIISSMTIIRGVQARTTVSRVATAAEYSMGHGHKLALGPAIGEEAHRRVSGAVLLMVAGSAAAGSMVEGFTTETE